MYLIKGSGPGKRKTRYKVKIVKLKYDYNYKLQALCVKERWRGTVVIKLISRCFTSGHSLARLLLA